MVDKKDFLNPTSMLTPGIAGGMAVSISLPLAMNFDISLKWLILVISFLLAFLIVGSFEEKIRVSMKGLYVVLNALIIFSVSIGAGISIDPPPAPSMTEIRFDGNSENSSLFANLAFISTAYASEGDDPVAIKEKAELVFDTQKMVELQAQLQKAREDAEREKALRIEQEKKIDQYNKANEKYNARWSW